MTTSTKLAMAFLALATSAGAPALADDEREGRPERMNIRFERMDVDNNGEVTFEEFAAVMDERLGDADKDGDGKMTVAEIAAEIERMRAERMAERLVKRFDTDGDGMLTKAEIESRQMKMFALLDRNDDGKIVRDELPKREGRREGEPPREGDVKRE